jgi:glucosamine--fructose-6-phosphate aminotransferase (isomerizing)
VIDNFQPQREQLTDEGHIFRSETDTEVIPHLIEKYFQGDLEQAVRRALLDIEGSYAFVVLCADCEELLVARKGSPLIVGLGDKEYFIASDVPAILDYTDRVVYLEDEDIGLIAAEGIRIANDGNEARRHVHTIPWSIEDAQKAGYEHYMLKEIHEQPRVIRDTLSGHISAVEPQVDLGITTDTGITDILMLACGTSYYAALVGKYVIENLARIPVRVELASEFNYSHTVLNKTWAIGITQSGETADTLMALKKAKALGCNTLAITNVAGSSVTRITDQTFYIKAGPEICVAATKSFMAQLIAFYLLALSSATMDVKSRENLITELRQLPGKVERVLNDKQQIAECGKFLSRCQSMFFVARGINHPVALEGALKMKELAYISAEGYAAGELKHGPFALLTPGTPVIAIITKDDTYDTLLANVQEVKARESMVIAVAGENDMDIKKHVDLVIGVPEVTQVFSPVVNAVVVQLLAYYGAAERACPIDMPRNLAKSVTVE